jgi:hypothetical protein
VKTVLRYLVPALLLAGAASALLAGSRLERRLAAADRALATLDLDGAAAGYDRVAGSLASTARVPWLLRGLRDTVAVKQAAVRYWRGEYAPIVTHYASPDSPSIAGNVDLQFLVANAGYRGAQRPNASREMALGTLDQAIGAYRRLLEANDAHLDAAFNYEVTVRLRNRIAAGGPVPEVRPPSVPGNEGDEPEEEDMEDVQIYVPRDRLVEPEETDDPTIGEGASIRRRG